MYVVGIHLKKTLLVVDFVLSRCLEERTAPLSGQGLTLLFGDLPIHTYISINIHTYTATSIRTQMDDIQSYGHDKYMKRLISDCLHYLSR